MDAIEAEEGPFLANDAKVSSLPVNLVLSIFCKYILKAFYVCWINEGYFSFPYSFKE
jgi:hypothetical protein